MSFDVIVLQIRIHLFVSTDLYVKGLDSVVPMIVLPAFIYNVLWSLLCHSQTIM